MEVDSAAIAQELNRGCYCAGVDVAALRAWLERDLKARGLHEPLVASHPHLFSAAPVFVGRSHAVQMQALVRAVETVIATPAFQEAVLADAPPIARRAPGPRGVFFGYDFHLTAEDGPKLIEINTNAGGAMLNTALMRAQRACCEPVAQLLNGAVSADALEKTFVDMFRSEWATMRFDRPLRRVAIVDDSPAEQYLYPEFLLFQRLFAASGVQAVVCDPVELHYEHGRLTRGGESIDLVYNRLTDFYLESPSHAALAAAYADGAVALTPHPYAHALYANKHNLVRLTDEAELRAMGVAQQLIDALLQGIPQTRSVSAEAADHWWSTRKQWFFKPVRGFGSRGSYRGDKVTKSAFAEVIRGDYVAQRIAAPSERWTSADHGETTLKLDLRNYSYAGEVQLIAARLYRGQTTNFRTPGGGFAPVYVIPQASAFEATAAMAASSP